MVLFEIVMKIDEITVLIPSLNEERNMKKCLDRLTEFQRVTVLDSKSKDKTRLIISKFKNVKYISTYLNDYVSKLNKLISLSKLNGCF